jgi:hypothetical protein
MRNAPDPAAYATRYDYSHAAVTYAMETGALQAPDHCEACGVTPDLAPKPPKHDSAFVWHHWSIKREHALNVIGLCRGCHACIHRGAVAEPRTGRFYKAATDWQHTVGLPLIMREAIWLFPGPRKADPLAPYLHLLGTTSDAWIGAKAGVISSRVRVARERLGIPGFNARPPVAA